MAEDLSRMWNNLSLLEDEDTEVEIPDKYVEGTDNRGKLCIVGKLIADRWIGKEIIKAKLIRGWKPMGTISFTVLGDNLFLVEFEYPWDKSRVLEGRPWVFEGSLFSVEDYDGVTPPNKIVFESVIFWVRMFNLPLSCMVKDVGYQIGSTMGMVEEVETDEDGIGWGKFLRVRIKFDLHKPIPRGRRVKLKGKSEWISFHYEKLPRVCSKCGVIKHGRGGCINTLPPGSKPQYGPWMRVLSPTRKLEENRGRPRGSYSRSEPEDQTHSNEQSGRSRENQARTGHDRERETSVKMGVSSPEKPISDQRFH